MPSFLDHLQNQPSTWLVLLLVLLVLVVGFWVGIRAARWVLRRRVGRTRHIGHRGEARATKLLRAAGYRVLETQVTARAEVEVDGERVPYLVRADALVERRGRTFVAEFKGGAGSASIVHRDTRRQLLEYALVFDAEGVILVDTDAGRVHEVRFPGLPTPV